MKSVTVFSLLFSLSVTITACEGESSSNVRTTTSETQAVTVENGRATIQSSSGNSTVTCVSPSGNITSVIQVNGQQLRCEDLISNQNGR